MVAFNKKTHKGYSLGIRKEGNQAKGIYRGTQKRAKTVKAKPMPTVKVNKSNTRKTKRKTAVEKLQNEAKAFAGTMAETRSSRVATLRARKAEVEAKAQRVKQAEENAERAFQEWLAKDAKRKTKAKAKAAADKAAKEWNAMDSRQHDAIIEEHRTARLQGRPIDPNILNLSDRFGKMSTGTVAHSTNSQAPWRGNTTKKYLKRIEEENEDFPYLSKRE